MPNTKELSRFYNELSKEIQLSKTSEKIAEKQFNTLTKIFQSKLDNIITFPQGSYLLGTTIKPLNSSHDDFDVDFIVAFTGINLDAKEIKMIIGKILNENRVYREKLVEKGRAWTVTYNNSHIDVVPAIIYDCNLYVTNKNNDGVYSFIKSDPKGFRDWFVKRSHDNAIIDTNANYYNADIHTYERRTILQKVVQLFKYDRNIQFKNTKEKIKPISMLITIICAELYNSEDDVFDALQNICSKIPLFMEEHKDINGYYHIYNPVESNEEFTDKWIEHPDRKEAFINWIYSLENRLVSKSLIEDRVSFTKRLTDNLGESVINAYKTMGEQDQYNQLNGKLSFDIDQGISIDGEYSNSVQRNNFYGDCND